MALEFVARNGIIAQNNSTITGSLTVTNGITGSISGTATSASFAVSASQAASAVSASFASNATSASFAASAATASYFLTSSVSSASFATSASYAATSSFASNFTVANTLTAQTLVVNTISSSVVYSSGSNVFGNSLSNTQVMTGSVNITGSFNSIGPMTVSGSAIVTGSLTALSLIKVGGTSSQYLMADGSTSLFPDLSSSIRSEQTYTATAGQTTFTVTGGYVVGLVDVYVNGVKYAPADYTATNGTTVVLGTGVVAGDIVDVINYKATIAALPTSRDVIDYTATAGQTTFTVTGGYVVGLLDVYVNGVKLTSSEYTATNGTTFVLSNASVVGDQVQAIRYNASVNGVSGAGTVNYHAKFTASQTLGNSLIQDDGTTITLGGVVSGSSAFFSGSVTVENNQNASTWITSKNTSTGSGAAAGFLMTNNTGDLGAISLLSSNNSPANALFIRTLSTNSLILGTNSTTNLTIASGGAATFTSSVTASTFTSNATSGIFLNNSSGGTDATQLRINNTSGDLRLGIESSGGATIQLGTLPYAAVFGNQANNATQFTTNGTARMTISAAGNVGIDTTSPQTVLQLGRVFGLNQDINSGYIDCNRTSTGNYIVSQYAVRIHVDSALGEIKFLNAASGTAGTSASLTERMRITSAGNVGIGTTSPANYTNYITQTVNGTNGAIVQLQSNGTASLRLIGEGVDSYLDNVSTGALIFRTTGSSTERMRITSGGNVGIGTSSPSGKFDVSGGYSYLYGLRISGNDTGNTIYQPTGDFSISSDGGNIRLMTNGSTNVVYFFTQGTERMRITSAGNIGIGTTSVGVKLEVVGTKQTIVSTDNGVVNITDNSGFAANSGGSLVFRGIYNSSGSTCGTGFIDTLKDNSTDGNYSYAMAFGSRSNGSSSIERMRIASSGNLLIGTTTDAAEANLSLGAKSTTEGGQLLLQKGTSQTYATHLDNYSDQFRLLYGTNTATTGVNLTIYHPSGNYLFSGSNVSDRRLKMNINTLSLNAVDKIKRLSSKSYNMTSDPDTLRYGFIAQEVQEILPDLITGTESDNDVLGLDYNGLLAVAIKAIQELTARVQELENK